MFILLSCKDYDSNQQSVKKDDFFHRFEISYSNGWTPGFTFLVDSTRVFFSPKTTDTVYYGVVPDSLMSAIQTTISSIQNDSSIKSNKINCSDCPLMSMEAVAKGKVIKLFQAGEIAPAVGKLIAQLKQFLQKSNLHFIPSTMIFETKYDAVEAPPKILKYK